MELGSYFCVQLCLIDVSICLNPYVHAHFYPCSFVHFSKLNMPCCSTICVLHFCFKLHLIWWRYEEVIWGRRWHVGAGIRVCSLVLMHGQGWRQVGGVFWLAMVMSCVLAFKWGSDRLRNVPHDRAWHSISLFHFSVLFMDRAVSHLFPHPLSGPFSL